ncbi:PPE domain-containing protein [Nocardia salmonicida]|uniref:PPE family protein n=1 Tax=Nocardia salmonicida TaxID=53431 RepID=A0ABZ1NDF3_9NOCA|nr:PPE domain-containing protein [Nocardia salmonicida]
MIEPPQPGFTGVVWSARPPEKLAHDLTSGAGSVPMAEAIAAWTRLAASYGAAVLEYEKVLVDLRGAWQSGRSDEVVQRVTTLRDWLLESSTVAASNAARLQAQVAAYEVARLSMPNTADIEAIQQVQRMLESMTGMLGAPIRAVAADADAEGDVAKAVASRVMENYEKATEPLATPWQHQEPPVIAPEKALSVERATVSPESPTMGAGGPTGLGSFPGMPVMQVVPRVLTAYNAPVYAQSATTAEVAARPTPVVAPAAGGHAPIAPGMMGQGAGAQEAPRFPRASLPEGSDQFGMEGEIRAAPAVLGDSGHAARADAAQRTEAQSGDGA